VCGAQRGTVIALDLHVALDLNVAFAYPRRVALNRRENLQDAVDFRKPCSSYRYLADVAGSH